jgi:hypothetical protein
MTAIDKGLIGESGHYFHTETIGGPRGRQQGFCEAALVVDHDQIDGTVRLKVWHPDATERTVHETIVEIAPSEGDATDSWHRHSGCPWGR